MPLLRWPTEVIGTVGNDLFQAAENTVYFGRSGDDTFYATTGVPSEAATPGDPLFIGGTGNDKYVIANQSDALIADGGDSAADVLVATGLGGPNTYFATIDGRHLVAGDLTTRQAFILLDWLQQANRIETFVLANGTFSFAQFQSLVFSSPHYGGNLPWELVISPYTTADANEAIDFYTSRSAFLETKHPSVATPANANVNLVHDVSVAASTLFSVSDPDGDTIQKYEFWDGGASGGYFSASGAPQPANAAIPVAAGDLAGVSWVAGKTPAVETVYVRAYDGIDWSAWASWTMTTLSRAPTVTPTAAEVLAPTGQAVSAST
ncbi:MAG TPA: hypothetical protein VMT29_12845, partial [Steroidobacteraceae bacterium]|nr:hypothetical protein [Steroidobacteraceae bacterium]